MTEGIHEGASREQREQEPNKVKFLFYHWDWDKQPDTKDLQRAIDAVFDGRHAPRIIEVEKPGWDQITIMIASDEVEQKKIRSLFQKYLKRQNEAEGDEEYWWETNEKPTTLQA